MRRYKKEEIIKPDLTVIVNCFLKNQEEPISKLTQTVTPAEAGGQKVEQILDSGFRRNDADGLLKLAQEFYFSKISSIGNAVEMCTLP